MDLNTFQTIGLTGRVGSLLDGNEVLGSIKSLIDSLVARGLTVIVDDEIGGVLGRSDLLVKPRSLIGEDCDLIIVIGGDGSMLGAARLLAKYDVPVLGINRGRLGFLTDILPHDAEQKVGEVLDGQYISENRFLLEVEVERDGEVIASAEALNDIVLNSGKSARMIEFELYIDSQLVYTQHSDGLIVSTPTGSTAYALSGGGPIMHPKLDAIVLVPMFPHTMSSRPIVVDSRSEIKLVIADCHPQISCDGQVHVNLSPNDAIFINKNPHRLRLIHPSDHNFYEICRDKLGWASRLGSNR